MTPTHELCFLEATGFGDIHRAMLEAFADYQLDMSYMTEQVLHRRAAKNGVDLACSPGAFQDGRLVGLTLVGLGMREGAPAAFDACTGIVKAHRGHGLAGRLFDFALPELKRRGVKRFLLEVLQENGPAIKAYERTGFRIVRPFDCFELAAEQIQGSVAPADIRPVGIEVLEQFSGDLDWQPSWENSFDAIRAVPGDVRLFGAFDGQACLGLVATHPLLRWIMTLVVKRGRRGRGLGAALLGHAVRDAGTTGRSLRASNVDPGDKAMVHLLEKAGFTRFTAQYEMACDLS